MLFCSSNKKKVWNNDWPSFLALITFVFFYSCKLVGFRPAIYANKENLTSISSLFLMNVIKWSNISIFGFSKLQNFRTFLVIFVKIDKFVRNVKQFLNTSWWQYSYSSSLTFSCLHPSSFSTTNKDIYNILMASKFLLQKKA